MPYYWENPFDPFAAGEDVYNGPPADELDYRAWFDQFRQVWRQGEHVALIGPTGSGKTHVSADILTLRSYVTVLSIKPHDDTLLRFTKRQNPRYEKVVKWPPNVQVNRALFVCKPDGLGDVKQRGRVYEVLNGVLKSEGWTLFLDDIAYLVNRLKLRTDVVDLLNVGRSSGITIVGALQQPTSVSANVPTEMKKQTKHVLLWKFTGRDELEACAGLCGMNYGTMKKMMDRLVYHDGPTDRYTDFIWYRRGYDPVIVKVA